MRDLELLEKLVSIPSVTGQEADAVRFLQTQARQDGFKVIDDHAGNFIAEKGEGPLLLFVGHIDTVPGHIPVRVEDGELWGRGSVDAKGSLAAAYCAARRYDGPNRVMVVGAVDEEGRSAGVKALPKLDPAAIIIGEPSGADGVTIGYKGILRCQAAIERTVVHGAHPDPSAGDAFVAFWQDLTQTFASGVGFDDVHARIDRLRSSNDGLMDAVQVQFQLRIPPEVSTTQAQAELSSLATRHACRVEVTEAMPAAMSNRRSRLVAAFSTAIRTTHTPRLKRKTGTADFNHLAQWYDCPIVAYGPGDSSLDHCPDERLDLQEFERAVDVLLRVFSTL